MVRRLVGGGCGDEGAGCEGGEEVGSGECVCFFVLLFFVFVRGRGKSLERLPTQRIRSGSGEQVGGESVGGG